MKKGLALGACLLALLVLAQPASACNGVTGGCGVPRNFATPYAVPAYGCQGFARGYQQSYAEPAPCAPAPCDNQFALPAAPPPSYGYAYREGYQQGFAAPAGGCGNTGFASGGFYNPGFVGAPAGFYGAGWYGNVGFPRGFRGGWYGHPGFVRGGHFRGGWGWGGVGHTGRGVHVGGPRGVHIVF